MYEYKAVCVSVRDGDSAWLEIDMGLRIYHKANCRLFGINTPELNSTDTVQREKAVAAKARLTELIAGKAMTIISKGFDKFGRSLVTIFIDGNNINQQMIVEGFADRYLAISHGNDLA